MLRCLGAVAIALLFTAQAGAAELVATAEPAGSPTPRLDIDPDAAVAPPLGAFEAPPAAPDDRAPPAQGVAACSEAVDRQPHGEVWAGIGSHGYRTLGTAMTAPIGKCASLSIAVSRTEGDFGGWRR